jgi:hypothetical protein
MDMKSRVIPEDTGFKFDDSRRLFSTGSDSSVDRFDEDDEDRKFYEHSQGGANVVGVLIVSMMAFVFGALCGFGFAKWIP